jgi:hypothetical protein
MAIACETVHWRIGFYPEGPRMMRVALLVVSDFPGIAGRDFTGPRRHAADTEAVRLPALNSPLWSARAQTR